MIYYSHRDYLYSASRPNVFAGPTLGDVKPLQVCLVEPLDLVVQKCHLSQIQETLRVEPGPCFYVCVCVCVCVCVFGDILPAL